MLTTVCLYIKTSTKLSELFQITKISGLSVQSIKTDEDDELGLNGLSTQYESYKADEHGYYMNNPVMNVFLL